jgi:uncharacterized membrane protein YqjE
MAPPESSLPGFWSLLRRFAGTFSGALQNRAELFVVELQEERYRLMVLLLLAGAAVVLGVLALVLFSGILIFVFPEPYRLYVALGLTLVYGLGVLVLVRQIRQRLEEEPFTETVTQIKKDWECLTPPK